MLENESIKFLKERIELINSDYPDVVDYKNALECAIRALEEVQQYRKHGVTVESALNNMCDLAAAENLIEEYRAIGTLEECRAAVEKQKEMITYCDENDCSDCPFHNTSKKYNKCMNDFIAEEIVKGGGVDAKTDF